MVVFGAGSSTLAPLTTRFARLEPSPSLPVASPIQLLATATTPSAVMSPLRRFTPPSSSARRVQQQGSPAGSCRCSSCVSLSCGDSRSVRRVELPVPARQVARRIRRRDREALHCIADGGHADGEAVVAAGLAVVAVPHLEVEVALAGVLEPQL